LDSRPVCELCPDCSIFGQAGVVNELARGREGWDVADLGGDRQTEQRADPGIVSNNATRGSARASGRNSRSERRQALVEPVDHRQRLGDRAPPHVRNTARLEHPQPVRPAQARDLQLQPPLSEHPVDEIAWPSCACRPGACGA
jgi:hypothetical protein